MQGTGIQVSFPATLQQRKYANIRKIRLNYSNWKVKSRKENSIQLVYEDVPLGLY